MKKNHSDAEQNDDFDDDNKPTNDDDGRRRRFARESGSNKRGGDGRSKILSFHKMSKSIVPSTNGHFFVSFVLERYRY